MLWWQPKWRIRCNTCKLVEDYDRWLWRIQHYNWFALVLSPNCLDINGMFCSSYCKPKTKLFCSVCLGPWPDENADAKKHHRPAKLSCSVGGAHGKWVTVSESEWEWASEWASGWVSEEEWAKPDWCLQPRQRISHWDPSSWKHWNGPAQWSIGACPLESRVVASWKRRCIGASQTCAIFNHGDAACNKKPC